MKELNTKIRWNMEAYEESDIERLSKDYNISKIAAKILISAGLHQEDDNTLKSFIHPRVKSCSKYKRLTHPDELKKGVSILSKHIKNKNKIFINGDSDADGITATTIILGACQFLGAKVDYDFPVRSKEGHGLQIRIIEKAISWGAKCIITTDCGTRDVEPVKYARSQGLDVIITDHHILGSEIPDASAIINPYMLDEARDEWGLAGAGVAFKFVVALSENLNVKFPKELFRFLLALTAIGMVSDRVSLKNVGNRALIVRGMQALNQVNLPGIEALKSIACQTGTVFKTRELGRTLSPLLNAPGRIGDPAKGIPDANVVVDLLIGGVDSVKAGLGNIVKQFLKALDLEKQTRNNVNDQAGVVEEVNEERKKITEKIANEIKDIIKKQVDLERDKIIMIRGENWNSGVIGIDADRLRDQYYRPVILVTDIIPEGYLKGSARSIPSINVYKVLDDVQEEFRRLHNRPLFQTQVATKMGVQTMGSFGGHTQACGFMIHQDDYKELKRLVLEAGNQFPDHYFDAKHQIVDELTFDDFTIKLYKQIESLAPYGEKFQFPLFVIRNVKFGARPRPFGSKYQKNKTPHLEFVILESEDEDKLSSRSRKMSAVGFGLWDKYHQLVIVEKKKAFDVIFSLDVRFWKQKQQLFLSAVDFREAGSES